MTKQILAAALLTVVVFSSSYAQKIAVSKGQKLESAVVMKMNMTIDMMGQNMENVFATTTTSELEVKEVNEKGFLIANTIKRVVSTISAMGNDMNFDSDKKEDLEGQMGEAYKDKINKPTEVLVGKDGKIAEAPEQKDASGGMGSMMNIEVLGKGQSYPMLIQLPTGKTLKIGDTWTDSSGTPETAKRVMQYTLKDIKGDDIIVAFTGTMAKKGTIQQGGMDIGMDMSGTMGGESVYEKASGWLKNNSLDLDIKGTMEVMGQSAPLTIKSNIVTTTKKL
jgi:Family of unknown function (DUF6263)